MLVKFNQCSDSYGAWTCNVTWSCNWWVFMVLRSSCKWEKPVVLHSLTIYTGSLNVASSWGWWSWPKKLEGIDVGMERKILQMHRPYGAYIFNIHHMHHKCVIVGYTSVYPVIYRFFVFSKYPLSGMDILSCWILDDPATALVIWACAIAYWFQRKSSKIDYLTLHLLSIIYIISFVLWSSIGSSKSLSEGNSYHTWRLLTGRIIESHDVVVFLGLLACLCSIGVLPKHSRWTHMTVSDFPCTLVFSLKLPQNCNFQRNHYGWPTEYH